MGTLPVRKVSDDADTHSEYTAGFRMIVVAFIAGGIAGLAAAAATLVFTDLGWAMALAAYFGAGYGLPLAVLAVLSLAKPRQDNLPATDMIRR